MRDRNNIDGVDFDTGYLLQFRDISYRTKARQANVGGHSGNIAGRKRGRGSIFYDVRPWSDGDDIRHIDPHKTARTGIPHIRTSHEDRENKIILIADFRPSMFFGTRRALRSVVAAEALSITGWRAVNARDQIGLVIATSRETTFVGWANNSAKFAGLLDKLASSHREARNLEDTCESSLDEIMEIARRRSGSASIIIATGLDAPGTNFDKTATLIARRRDLIFLLISDKFERQPLPGDYPYYTREGDTGILHITPRLATKSLNDWPERLARLGAKSLGVASELEPPEMARVLDRFYDGSR